jgi:membrane fusion protein, multidrug efflux system
MPASGATASTAAGPSAMYASRLVRQGMATRLLGALSLRAVLIGVIPALVAVAGLALYLFSGRYVGTDNAFIGAQKVLITPEVSGKVVSIAVIEGQALRRGDELLSIDPAPYRFAAQEAEARLVRIGSEFANLKSMMVSLGRQIELAQQGVVASRSDYDRKASLLRERYSAPADLDRANVVLMAAQAQLERLQQQQEAVRHQLLGDPALPLERYPPHVEALVARERARRDLANTVLRAPIDGIATQVTSIQMGRYLMAGTPVFSVVGTEAIWVDANPKETDMTHVRPGQPVSITVDAFPAKHWTGTLAAISPGTGAQFTILPPQNAAGNWIKIVQRVPVRVEFSSGQDLRRLRAGMSAYIEIDTGRVGVLASLFGSSAVAEGQDE